jgi:hypothetical protein
MCDDWTRTYTPKLFAPITIKRRRKLAHHMPCWCRHLDLRGLNLNHPCAVFPRRDSDVNILALLFFYFSNFLTMKKKTARLLNQSIAGYKRRRTKFPILLSSEIIPRKKVQREKSGGKTWNIQKVPTRISKGLSRQSLFFAVLYKLMRRPALMQNVDIITEKSREKFVPVWKRRRTWRHEDRSESGGHDESNKGKIWIARHRRVPPREPEENRSLVDTRVLSRFPTFLQCFFFPESGNANEGIHSTAITRNLFPENCQFNESRLIVYVYSTHQH